jgi:hypothetical protein
MAAIDLSIYREKNHKLPQNIFGYVGDKTLEG